MTHAASRSMTAAQASNLQGCTFQVVCTIYNKYLVIVNCSCCAWKHLYSPAALLWQSSLKCICESMCGALHQMQAPNRSPMASDIAQRAHRKRQQCMASPRAQQWWLHRSRQTPGGAHTASTGPETTLNRRGTSLPLRCSASTRPACAASRAALRRPALLQRPHHLANALAASAASRAAPRRPAPSPALLSQRACSICTSQNYTHKLRKFATSAPLGKLASSVCSARHRTQAPIAFVASMPLGKRAYSAFSACHRT
jgi:hypothetical protein